MFRISGLALAAVAAACSSPDEPTGGDPTDPSDTSSDPCEVPGNICTWAGQAGQAILAADGIDRLDPHGGFYWPHDVLFTPSGDAYVADFNNHRIRKIDPDGIVTTLSGSGWLGDGPPAVDSCWFGCDLASSDWWHPVDIALDPTFPDVLWIASWHNHRVVRVDLVGSTMEWWAGAGEAGARDGEPEQVLMAFPSSVVAGPDGIQYFSDQFNHTIRRILPGGIVETIAGKAGEPSYSGDGGPAAEARLRLTGTAIGGAASRLMLDGHQLYVADCLNSVIRVIDLDTGTIELAAGEFRSDGVTQMFNELTGVPYTGERAGLDGYAGDGGDALDARFARPRDIAKGPSGDLFVADTGNHCVRRIDSQGIVSTVAGRCGVIGFAGDGGPAAEAQLHLPSAVDFDADGNLYIADTNNHVIRRVARDW